MTVTPPLFARRHERRRTWQVVGIIVVATLVAYSNSLRGPFVFDDIPSLLENASIRTGSTWSEKFWPPSDSVSVAGRPLLNASFALNYAMSGYRTWSYHLLNVLIHLAAGLTVFGLLRRTLRTPRLQAEWGERSTWLAGLIAVIWLVHPLQTQAVTYTVQRAESLMGFFFLFTVYAFARGAETSSRGWLVASWGACVLGVATKEVIVAVPVLVLLYDRTLIAGSFSRAWSTRRTYYGMLFSTWLILAGLVLAAGGNRGGSAGIGSGVSASAYWLTQFVALTHYLRLCVWPFPLVFEYGTFWVKNVSEIWPQIVLIAGLVFGILWGLIARAPWALAGAWCACILAPTSLTPGTTQMIVEHRLYLPLMAVISLAVLAFERRWRRWTWLVGLVIVVAGIALTLARNSEYRSAVVLWGQTVRRQPQNGRAQGNFAQALVAAGRPAEALEHYALAEALMPEEPRFPYNLGFLYMQSGRGDEAVAAYARAVKLAPDDAPMRNNLAIAYAAKGNLSAALVQSAVALKLQPDNPELHYNRGLYLSQLHRGPEAVLEYESALRLRPLYAEAQTNLGNQLLADGRLADAKTHYEAALALAPQSSAAHANLAMALLRQGNVSAARAHYGAVLGESPLNFSVVLNLSRLVLQLDQPAAAVPLLSALVAAQPEDISPRLFLAEAYFKSGEFTDAVAEYRKILERDPTNSVARQNLAAARSQMAPNQR